MYVVKSTLFVPAGSRIVGEAWAVISGAGATFKGKKASDRLPLRVED